MGAEQVALCQYLCFHDRLKAIELAIHVHVFCGSLLSQANKYNNYVYNIATSVSIMHSALSDLSWYHNYNIACSELNIEV